MQSPLVSPYTDIGWWLQSQKRSGACTQPKLGQTRHRPSAAVHIDANSGGEQSRRGGGKMVHAVPPIPVVCPSCGIKTKTWESNERGGRWSWITPPGGGGAWPPMYKIFFGVNAEKTFGELRKPKNHFLFKKKPKIHQKIILPSTKIFGSGGPGLIWILAHRRGGVWPPLPPFHIIQYCWGKELHNHLSSTWRCSTTETTQFVLFCFSGPCWNGFWGWPKEIHQILGPKQRSWLWGVVFLFPLPPLDRFDMTCNLRQTIQTQSETLRRPFFVWEPKKDGGVYLANIPGSSLQTSWQERRQEMISQAGPRQREKKVLGPPLDAKIQQSNFSAKVMTRTLKKCL